ncbi:MAG TPA: hypothetical protein VGG03_01865 [Thermoanaerobaculia bacterium]|jgi:hypothetical protein
MRTNKENKEKKEKRILARIMSKELSEEQLKKVAAAAGTCTMCNDADANLV